jgi:hypothetical protein
MNGHSQWNEALQQWIEGQQQTCYSNESESLRIVTTNYAANQSDGIIMFSNLLLAYGAEAFLRRSQICSY